MPIVTVADMVERARSRISAMKIAPPSGFESSRAAAREFEMAIDALEHLAEHWLIIDQLRAPEGASVTLICDNPDFGSPCPDAAVEVCDGWTDWKNIRFGGDNVLEALRAALQSQQGGGWWLTSRLNTENISTAACWTAPLRANGSSTTHRILRVVICVRFVRSTRAGLPVSRFTR